MPVNSDGDPVSFGKGFHRATRWSTNELNVPDCTFFTWATVNLRTIGGPLFRIDQAHSWSIGKSTRDLLGRTKNQKVLSHKGETMNSAQWKLPCGHTVNVPTSFQSTIGCPYCRREFVLVWIKNRPQLQTEQPRRIPQPQRIIIGQRR